MVQKQRISKELSLLNLNKYIFDYDELNKGIELRFITTHGNIIFHLPSQYPFSPPKIYIEEYLKLDSIYTCKIRLYFRSFFPSDIINNICNYLYEINSDKIIYKKYLHDIIKIKTDYKDKNDIIWKYDNMLLDGWSPAINIIDIINFFEEYNNILNLKKENQLKFSKKNTYI